MSILKWLFHKEVVKVEENPKVSAREQRIKELEAWRGLGETFEYLGRTMCVTRHYGLATCGYSCYRYPAILADYADNNGKIHSVTFTVDEIEAIQRTQP